MEIRQDNNNLLMWRGETPTYSAYVIDKDSGAPYVLDSGIHNPILEFVVREDKYARDDNYVFKADLLLELPDLDGSEIIYDNTLWDEDHWNDGESPDEGNERKIHCARDNYREDHYAYYNSDERKWIDYTFEIIIPLPHYLTKQFEGKRYFYEIDILGGNKKSDVETIPKELYNKDLPIVVDYKEIILRPSEFNVEESLSE